MRGKIFGGAATVWEPRALLCALSLILSLLLNTHAHALVLDSPVILRQQAGVCALTFDDGPTQYTATLLDALRVEGVTATFFVLGKQVQYRPQLVRRMMEEGHEVATHGFSHPNMRKISFAAQQNDLIQAMAQLHEMGIMPRSFRPPYGRYDEALSALAESMGLSLIMWTTDSRDWKRRPADYRSLPSTFGRHLGADEMRGIFLFHDTRPGTVEDISKIISDLRESGCTRFVTVTEYMDSLPPADVYHAAQGKRKNAAKGDSVAATPHAPIIVPVAASSASTPKLGQEPVQEPTQESARIVAEVPLHTQELVHISTVPAGIPAGTTPVPMARSSSPWRQPMLLRGRAQGT